MAAIYPGVPAIMPATTRSPAGDRSEHRIDTEGEPKRLRIARELMTDPERARLDTGRTRTTRRSDRPVG
jgi:hypothetical protein